MKTVEEIWQEIAKLKAERLMIVAKGSTHFMDAELLYYYDGQIDVLEWVLEDGDENED
jgi:hypothetical protein